MNVLHLSDLQFGITAKLSKKGSVAIRKREIVLEKKLLNFLQNEIPTDWKPDIVVISGDLAWSATKSDYEKFGKWLKKLLDVLGVPIQNVILCTGNHDINTFAAEANSENRKELNDKANIELIPDATEGKIYEKFSEFISFCKGEIDPEIVIEPLENILPEESEGRYLYGYRDLSGLRF